MTKKYYAGIGMIAPVLFWITYFIMAGARPEYNFYTKAISELGSVDAPHKWTGIFWVMVFWVVYFNLWVWALSISFTKYGK